MRKFASNKTRSPTAIRPVSGVASPATQSSSVVFPDPDGPNNMVNPGSTLKSTSRENSRAGEKKLLRMRALKGGVASFGSAGVGIGFRLFDRTDHPRSLLQRSPVQTVHHREHYEAEDQQQYRHAIGRGIVRSLHLIVDVNGDGAGHAGNIAADHQHHSKLAHGVSKHKSHACDQAGHGERNHHAKEGA